jgi:hypothetical protein
MVRTKRRKETLKPPYYDALSTKGNTKKQQQNSTVIEQAKPLSIRLQ